MRRDVGPSVRRLSEESLAALQKEHAPAYPTTFTLVDNPYRTGGPARYVTVKETGGRLGFIVQRCLTSNPAA